MLISARNSNVDSGFQFAEWELYGTAIANYDITDNEGQITGQYVGNLSDTNNELVDKVIDNNSTTKYLVKDYSQLWIQYQSPVKARLTSYNITSANDENTRDIKTWALYGSNDGNDWSLLDNQVNQYFAIRYSTQTYPCKTDVSYNYFKLDIMNNNGSTMNSSSRLAIVW